MVKQEFSVEAINRRLSSAHAGIVVVQRGSKLSLRGTFPPRPGSKQRKPYQQYVALGLYASHAGLKAAEGKALEFAGLLSQGKFEWAALDIGGASDTCGDWIARFKKDWIAQGMERYKGDAAYAELRFNTIFGRNGFRKLPESEKLTGHLLRNTVKRHWKPNKAITKRVCGNYARLAKFAGIEVSFKDLQGDYSNANVKRTIPTDEQIVSWIDGIKNRGWQWIAAMMATYGLRDHEAFLCTVEWQEYGDKQYLVALVPEATKTGAREVFPLPIEWVSRWRLDEVKKPPVNVRENSEYGSRTSIRFNAYNAPFKPYDLRHAYALRAAIDNSLPPVVAAGLMGHSPAMNAKIYQKHMDSARMKRAYLDSVEKG
jgi:integrase